MYKKMSQPAAQEPSNNDEIKNDDVKDRTSTGDNNSSGDTLARNNSVEAAPPIDHPPIQPPDSGNTDHTETHNERAGSSGSSASDADPACEGENEQNRSGSRGETVGDSLSDTVILANYMNPSNMPNYDLFLRKHYVASAASLNNTQKQSRIKLAGMEATATRCFKVFDPDETFVVPKTAVDLLRVAIRPPTEAWAPGMSPFNVKVFLDLFAHHRDVLGNAISHSQFLTFFQDSSAIVMGFMDTILQHIDEFELEE